MPLQNRSMLSGFVAGAVGGALGTLVLNLFQTASLEGTRRVEEKVADGETYTRQQQELIDSFEKAHVKTAKVAAKSIGARIPLLHRKRTAAIVEYAFGTLCGGIYGAAAEFLPPVTTGFGTVYGATLFLGASEAVLPAIGFVAAPSKRTPVQHMGGLVGNMVYGATTEAVRRLLRPAR